MLLARVFGGSLVMRLDRVRLVGAVRVCVGQSWILVRGYFAAAPPLIDFWQWC